MNSAEPVQVVDFFSGCGGTSLGLENAGGRVVLGIDNDAIAGASYRLNFPRAAFLEADVFHLHPQDISHLVPYDAPLLFAGCAPCQPFSMQNRRRGREDSRAGLLAEFERFIAYFSPEYVLVENVPGIQTAVSNGVLDRFSSNLERLGYKVTVAVVRALDYGVPQTRRRLVLVASLMATATVAPSDEMLDAAGSWRTVRHAIEGLPELGAGESDPDDSDHTCMALSDKNIRRIRATPEGGSRNDWTDLDLQLECHRSHTGHTDVYGRLAWDKPATAMTTRCISYSNGRFGHPDQDRAISLREAALIQTFPRTFKFVGTLTQRARQVGNAVPPRMAEALGRGLLSAPG